MYFATKLNFVLNFLDIATIKVAESHFFPQNRKMIDIGSKRRFRLKVNSVRREVYGYSSLSKAYKNKYLECSILLSYFGLPENRPKIANSRYFRENGKIDEFRVIANLKNISNCG